MALFSVTCPNCNTIMKSSKPIPIAKKIRCLKCKQPFVTPAEKPVPSPPSLPPPPPMEDFDDEIVETEADDEIIETEADEVTVPRRRRRVRPDDEDDYDEPPRRRRKRDDDYEDDDEDDDAPVRTRKRGKKSSKGLMIGLIGGGVGLAAVIGIVLFLLLGSSGTERGIIGKWMPERQRNSVSEFTSDGRLNEYDMNRGQKVLSAKYSISGDIITVTLEEFGMPPGMEPTIRYRAEVNGDRLTLTPVSPTGHTVGQPKRFTRYGG